MATERVTVTLPAEILQEIDRRRRQALQRSLRNPHPDSAQLAEDGFDDRASHMPDEDVTELVDVRAGKPVRWVPGEGWAEASE